MGPIWSEEAEKSVLGACLIDREALVKASEILRPEMFYAPHHQAIYKAMIGLMQEEEPVDLTTVTAAVEKHDGKDGKRAAYIAELAVFTPTAAHVEAYARDVREKWIRREMARAAARITELAEFPDLTAALMQAEQAIFRLSQQGLKPVSYFGQVVVDRWDELARGRDNPQALGIMTGFKKLDDALGGLQPSDLVVVAARPSMGKTAFAQQVALNVARAGRTVLMFSLETGEKLLADRAICSEARIDSQELRARVLSGDEWDRGTKAVSRLAGLPLWVDDTPAITTLEMRAKARRLAAEREDLGLVVVDYLQLIGDRPEHGWNREQTIGQITDRCKAMARELNCPVLLLSQLNREVEKTGDKVPQLSHLRESGTIEQTADIVLFIHRPEYYQKTDEPGIAKVIIAKHRNGPTGVVKLQFEKRFTRFNALAEGYEDGEE